MLSRRSVLSKPPNNSMEPTRPAGGYEVCDTGLGWPRGSSRGRRALNVCLPLDPRYLDPYSTGMRYLECSRIAPTVRGKPTVCGTGITVHDILEYPASGMSQEEILADFPDLPLSSGQPTLRASPLSPYCSLVDSW